MPLEQVVPWGRSLVEYCRMFSLGQHDLEKRILGCADGPASFNAELTRLGGSVVSLDPIYQFSAKQIGDRIAAATGQVMDHTLASLQEFVWSPEIPDPSALERIRLTAMNSFLEDFREAGEGGRYIAGQLPSLPFEDVFELAVCSHFLFLYSDQLTEQFHLDSIRELCRVAQEVRIFPLVDLSSQRSRHLEPVTTKLLEAGYRVSIDSVPYEFQRGGNQMLRVR